MSHGPVFDLDLLDANEILGAGIAGVGRRAAAGIPDSDANANHARDAFSGDFLMAESTARGETFSDGVFAIAITLLILEIPVPPADARGLWVALGALQTGDRHVVIVSPEEGDGRLAFAREAITFWNQTFSDLNLRPRLLEAELIVASPINRALENYARQISQAAGRLAPGAAGSNAPRELTNLGGDIVVFLSKQEIFSFAWPLAQPTRFFIAVRTDRAPPLSHPNVSRNVIAHELGHALGLTHNSNPTTLMCGPCQPLVFGSEERVFFPLTPEDRARLLELHAAR